MEPDEIEAIIRHTWDDFHLSRGEKQALRQLAIDWQTPPHLLAHARRTAFAIAREAVGQGEPAALDWLEEVTKALQTAAEPVAAGHAEAVFSPGEACLRRLTGLLLACRRRADICVFTISDDRIAQAILEAHRRGVGVRVLTDNEKLHDAGSDVDRLAAAGIPVRIDESEAHLHHKFAVFDRQFIVTGSYNWTRSAASVNWENLVVLSDPRLIASFEQEFDRLWELHPRL